MDVDELLAGGARRQPPVEVAVPLVRDVRAASNVRTSLDVLALKMIGRQAPRRVLQVDVLVPLIQETTVHGIPEVQFVERPPAMSETPVTAPAAHESVAGWDEALVCSKCAQLLRFRWETEVVARRSCSCTEKWAISGICCAMAKL